VNDPAQLSGYITLRNSANQEPIALTNEGVVITEKLSKQLGIGVGDAFQLDNGDGAVKKVRVAAVTEQYVFHYV
jgi:putative ABC transport system permease protein